MAASSDAEPGFAIGPGGKSRIFVCVVGRVVLQVRLIDGAAIATRKQRGIYHARVGT